MPGIICKVNVTVFLSSRESNLKVLNKERFNVLPELVKSSLSKVKSLFSSTSVKSQSFKSTFCSHFSCPTIASQLPLGMRSIARYVTCRGRYQFLLKSTLAPSFTASHVLRRFRASKAAERNPMSHGWRKISFILATL